MFRDRGQSSIGSKSCFCLMLWTEKSLNKYNNCSHHDPDLHVLPPPFVRYMHNAPRYRSASLWVLILIAAFVLLPAYVHNYDLLFSPKKKSSAYKGCFEQVDSDVFSVRVWVRFHTADDTGTFFSLFNSSWVLLSLGVDNLLE